MATRPVRLPEDRALFDLVSCDGKSIRFRCPICDDLTGLDAGTACAECAAVATGGDR